MKCMRVVVRMTEIDTKVHFSEERKYEIINYSFPFLLLSFVGFGMCSLNPLFSISCCKWYPSFVIWGILRRTENCPWAQCLRPIWRIIQQYRDYIQRGFKMSVSYVETASSNNSVLPNCANVILSMFFLRCSFSINTSVHKTNIINICTGREKLWMSVSRQKINNIKKTVSVFIF